MAGAALLTVLGTIPAGAATPPPLWDKFAARVGAEVEEPLVFMKSVSAFFMSTPIWPTSGPFAP